MKARTKNKCKGNGFTPGTVVIFEPNNFHPVYWQGLSDKDKKKYYGPLGYGRERQLLFVFICEIKNAPGHCVLLSLEDGHVETMRHTYNFREVTEEEM